MTKCLVKCIKLDNLSGKWKKIGKLWFGDNNIQRLDIGDNIVHEKVYLLILKHNGWNNQNSLFYISGVHQGYEVGYPLFKIFDTKIKAIDSKTIEISIDRIRNYEVDVFLFELN